MTASSMGGQAPANGSAAAQVAEVVAELQKLPKNGQIGQLARAAPRALHKSALGSPMQPQPLQVVY